MIAWERLASGMDDHWGCSLQVFVRGCPCIKDAGVVAQMSTATARFKLPFANPAFLSSLSIGESGALNSAFHVGPRIEMANSSSSAG
jgi:hypothetical protein